MVVEQRVDKPLGEQEPHPAYLLFGHIVECLQVVGVVPVSCLAVIPCQANGDKHAQLLQLFHQIFVTVYLFVNNCQLSCFFDLILFFFSWRNGGDLVPQ